MLQLATKGILFHPSLPYKGIIPTVRSIPPVVIITSDNGGRSYYGRYGKNKELKTRNINIYIKKGNNKENLMSILWDNLSKTNVINKTI